MINEYYFRIPGSVTDPVLWAQLLHSSLRHSSEYCVYNPKESSNEVTRLLYPQVAIGTISETDARVFCSSYFAVLEQLILGNKVMHYVVASGFLKIKLE